MEQWGFTGTITTLHRNLPSVTFPAPFLAFFPLPKYRGRFLISLSMTAKAGRTIRTRGFDSFLAQEAFWVGISALTAITMHNISAQMLERLWRS